MSARRIVVLGGGISGLAAANRCRELAAERGADVEVTVLERAPRAGGCIETRTSGGVIAELGPDSIVTEKPAAVALAGRLLGDAIEPMRPEYRGARIVRNGRLLPIPDDFRLFAPTTVAGMIRSGLFGPLGVLRAAVEPFVPPRRTSGDESVASFVTRRFGHEVLDRLAQPLIGGIYSGDPRRLSMEATLPMMLQIEKKYGSMVRGFREAARAQNGSKQPLQRLVSLRGGLGSLIEALERELGSSLRTASAVTRLSLSARDDGSSVWNVALSGGTSLEADAIICALPARAAADVLAEAQPELGARLRSIAYHSVATVTLAYASDALPPLPRCTGFVVPFAEGRSIMSVTISSQKFAGRAPEGTTLLRAFAGGALQPQIAAMNDDGLLATVREELLSLLGIACEPRWTIVRRWQHALPEYAVGHLELVTSIEREAARLPAFAFAGSAYHGVGIADCIRTGEDAAAAVIA
jgi:oxygen-dependent protoporphyrinogen oxidase